MARASADMDRLSECPICIETMIQPKQLPCGHSVCGGCMDDLCARGMSFLLILCKFTYVTVLCVGSVVECPTCREKSTVPKKGFPINYPLSAMIEAQTEEKKAKEKQCHKCMMCAKLFVLEEMMICQSCNGMCLCFRCFCRSHNGHQNEELHDLIDTQVKQLEQWKQKLAILEPLTSPSSVVNQCKLMLDQHLATELRIDVKRKELEDELSSLIESKDKNLNPASGYKFNLDRLEDQFHTIEVEHKEAITKRQELANAMTKMLVSDDLLGADEDDSGILLVCNQSLMFYSPNTKQHFDLDIAVGHCLMMGLLADDKIVMVAGGYVSGYGYRKEIKIIDLVSKKVMVGPSMTVGRMFASSAMIGGDMYVCGGEDVKDNPLTSCEVYRDGQWMEVANMIVPRSLHAVVAFDGLLYAIGGFNRTGQTQSSIECYSPDTDSWRLVTSLNQDIPGDCSAAALNGFIYVAGGDTSGRSKTVECYDPKENKWLRAADMNKKRPYNQSLVSVGGKLYALGVDEFREYSVESYDPATNEWKMEYNDISPLQVVCAVAVGSHLSNIIMRSTS